MKYSEVIDLSETGLALCVIECAMRRNAVKVPGGVIMAIEICQSEAGKYYFSLSVEPNAHKCGEYIEPAQISEYYKQHPDECAEPCAYCTAAEFYDIYGHEMHAAAALIFGAEYAAEWLQKWQAGKGDALSAIAFACSRSGNADKYEEVQAIAEQYKADPPKIEEIADIEQIQIEAARIAKQIGKQATKPAQCRIDADKLESIKLAAFKYYQYDKIDMLQFAAKVVAAAEISHRAACAEINKVYTSGMLKTKPAEYGKKPRPLMAWAKFCRDILRACGLNFKPYKPNKLEKKGA